MRVTLNKNEVILLKINESGSSNHFISEEQFVERVQIQTGAKAAMIVEGQLVIDGPTIKSLNQLKSMFNPS